MRKFLGLILMMIGTIAFAQSEKGQENYRKGVASFYHDKFVGRKTSNGEIFDNKKFTAASNVHKLGTYVKVTNEANGKVVYVKINDRMAPSNKRLLDLAKVAAKELNFVQKGLTKVKVETVSVEEGKAAILAQNEGKEFNTVTHDGSL